jgi:3-isopropylmalate/(R)-2-methylmalate dehydratase large subunit
LGAVGAFASGIGSSEQTYVLYKGDLWFKVPESLKFVIEGQLPPYASGKDIILMILGQLGETGALYKAVEFSGPVVDKLNIDGRIPLCGLIQEMGGKIGVVPADDKVVEYMKARTKEPFEVVIPDPDAVYENVYTFDVTAMESQVATPSRMDQVHPVTEVTGTPIDQVYIGSCVNGGLEDLAVAAKILKGHQVNPNVRTIIVPQSRGINEDAIKAGYVEIFAHAGAMMTPPGCGPCVGSHSGVLAPGERVVSTGCRNFSGRMGSPEAEIYVASPATAAASAIEGKIADPKKFF